MYQILLVDDHPAVGIGTKNMIERSIDIKVSFVKSGALALELINKIKFDLILCDLYMPTMDGISLSKLIMERDSSNKIFIFTGHPLDHLYNELLEIGVSGFLDKSMTNEELNNHIRCALNGETIIPTALFRQLRKKQEEPDKSDKYSLKWLTSKEQQLVKHIYNGLSNKQIAELVYLSQRGVEYQIQNLFRKLEVSSRSELVKLAIENGWFN